MVAVSHDFATWVIKVGLCHRLLFSMHTVNTHRSYRLSLSTDFSRFMLTQLKANRSHSLAHCFHFFTSLKKIQKISGDFYPENVQHQTKTNTNSLYALYTSLFTVNFTSGYLFVKMVKMKTMSLKLAPACLIAAQTSWV